MKIKILGVIAIWVLVFLLFKACRHEPIKPPDEPIVSYCHPDTVYFNRDILPLLSASCARSGCHDAITQADGVRLTDYESVMQTADVRPGNPESSDLYEVLVEDDPDKRMPPSPNEPLTSTQIQLIFTWITQGALNLECIEDGCDLENVTFSQTVFPNLQNYGCVSCHSGNSPSGNLLLSSYAHVQVAAESGRLMGAILRLAGYAPMPPSGNAMSECAINQIQKWIDNEMPNN
jgi:hypothetical protein